MSNQTSSLEFTHFPVMLNEVIKILTPSSDKKFIDCTFGGGGYSRELLKLSNNEVYAIDRDKDKSSFSVYRHTSEMPLYKIVKNHKIKKPDEKWRVLSMSGHEIKRNRNLDSILKFLSGKRLILLKK